MKHFHLAAFSGILATAGTEAGGALFAFHNNSLNVLHIQRVRAKLNIVVPGTAQEIAIELALALFGDDYTDGKNLSNPSVAADYAVRNRNLDKSRVLISTWRPISSLASGNVRIGDTTDLTAGASPPTIDAHPFAWEGDYFDTTATSVKPKLDLLWTSPTLGQDYERPCDGCIPLEEDRGFIIRLPIDLATATARLAVEVDWIES